MSTTEKGSTPMKKTIYAVLGLAGACAACCAIPIAWPMFAGASLAGAAGWAVGDSKLLIAGAAAGIVGLAMFLRRRALQGRSGASCATPTATTATLGGSCGCSGGPDSAGQSLPAQGRKRTVRFGSIGARPWQQEG